MFAGGDLPDGLSSDDLADASVVVAADSGLRHARSLALRVHAVVGDLDSASDDDLVWARSCGAEVISFPADKDATDLELAMAHAEAIEGIDRLVIVAVEGGRLDHEMGNWAVCCGPWGAAVEVITDRGRVVILRGDGQYSVDVSGAPGEVLSLLARTGPASGVYASGLRWPLSDATLLPNSSLGISNELTASVAKISVEDGVLLVVRAASSGSASS